MSNVSKPCNPKAGSGATLKAYDDCKIGIWVVIIVTVLFGGWLLTAILAKISLIPVLLLFRH